MDAFKHAPGGAPGSHNAPSANPPLGTGDVVRIPGPHRLGVLLDAAPGAGFRVWLAGTDPAILHPRVQDREEAFSLLHNDTLPLGVVLSPSRVSIYRLARPFVRILSTAVELQVGAIRPRVNKLATETIAECAQGLISLVELRELLEAREAGLPSFQFDANLL